jgi:hypothetical protein
LICKKIEALYDVWSNNHIHTLHANSADDNLSKASLSLMGHANAINNNIDAGRIIIKQMSGASASNHCAPPLYI